MAKKPAKKSQQEKPVETSAPQQGATNSLPVMYNGLYPLMSNEHSNWKMRSTVDESFVAKINAVPLLVDEFIAAQRFFPIVFSQSENSLPLALMGLHEGINVFVDEKGALLNPVYIPAYMRRYPFMLARMGEEAENLSLCFDPSSGHIGEFDDGEPLFVDGKPSQVVENVLKLCEEFELSAQRTNLFLADLNKTGLLIDGEITIQLNEQIQPATFRGFKIVDEKKFRELSAEDLHKYNKSGMLPLILAHLFSLSLWQDLYLRHISQGKGPQPVPISA